MEAMILAAGAGTRLRPVTDRIPKALVAVGGRPLLGLVMKRVAEAGATRIVVNTHHHEEQIRDYLRDHTLADVDVAISSEPDGPYDTGGGLFAAAPLFQEEGPFLLHNVDVLSNIPLDGLVEEHLAARARMEGVLQRPTDADAGTEGAEAPPRRSLVASLAVQARDAARRRLLFDDLGLMGWENWGSDRAPEGFHRVREPVGDLRRWSFTGIHVVEPGIFGLSARTGTFSIITLYLELAAQGHMILPIDCSDHDWIDIGTPERLAEAERAAAEPDQ